ncbi:MAG: peroxiredoxin [Planctomycetota bacterium]
MYFAKNLLITLIATCLLSSSVDAQSEKRDGLQVGDRAPNFVGVDDEDKKWDSKDKAGKKIYVVYFYPADMTPGCTRQACAYRDAVKEMTREDVEIVGVSGDAVENHKHFKEQYELNFTLLSDSDGKIAKAFGVRTRPGGSITRQIGDLQLTLERGVTASRWTFIIDKDWKIAHKDTQVNAIEDSERVLAEIEKLK